MSSTEFRVDLRNIEFTLFEHLDMVSLLKRKAYSDFSTDDMKMTMEEAARTAENIFAPMNIIADREGCRFDNGNVFVPHSFHKAYRKYLEGGWLLMGVSEEGAVWVRPCASPWPREK